MKVKDLFNYVEGNNKYNEFMSTSNNGYKEVMVVKIDDYAFRNDEFTSAKDLVEAINNEMYGNNITVDAELKNDRGYIELDFVQRIPDYVDGKFEYKYEDYFVHLYVETKQIW